MAPLTLTSSSNTQIPAQRYWRTGHSSIKQLVRTSTAGPSPRVAVAAGSAHHPSGSQLSTAPMHAAEVLAQEELHSRYLTLYHRCVCMLTPVPWTAVI